MIRKTIITLKTSGIRSLQQYFFESSTILAVLVSSTAMIVKDSFAGSSTIRTALASSADSSTIRSDLDSFTSEQF